MALHAAPLDARTMAQLEGASAKGVDPELTRSQLQALGLLVEGGIEQLEAALPGQCDDAPEKVAAAARHLMEGGGKRVRPLMLMLSARAAMPGKKPPAGVRNLAIAAELVHNATLLHDDVIDDGCTRRGRPASRILWGNAVSVLGGDFLLARALELVEAAATPGALVALLSTIRRMVEGEALQLDGRGQLEPDEERYFEVIDGKTASLFAWCGRAGSLAAGNSSTVVEALERYGLHLGRAFQLVDDVIDLAGDPSAAGKDLLSDLREGKLGLPVLLALKGDPSLTRFLERVAANPDPEDCRDEASTIVRQIRYSGALDKAREAARTASEAACAQLDAVPAGTCREALAAVARELAARGA